jgi:CBS domain-containing protein
MLRVRDIMTESVFTLSTTATLEVAARDLVAHRVTGAPVVDDRRVVGILSKSDLADPDRGLARDPRAPVSAAMTPLVFSLRPSDPASAAVKLMLYEGVHRLVVLKDGGELAGIVSPMDVLQVVSRGEALDDGEHVDPHRIHPHADPEMVRAVADDAARGA